MNITTGALLLLLPVLGSTLAAADDWTLQSTRSEHSKMQLARLKERIQAQGSPALKSIDSQVELVLSNEGANEPRSSRNVQGRKIEMPDAFVARTINLARLATLAVEGSDLGCVARYKTHMDRTGSRAAPEKYLVQAGSTCSALSGRLPLGAVKEAMAEQELNATLEFAYLHELGHQYYDHSWTPLPQDVSTRENQCQYLHALAQQRTLEYEADSFAVDALGSLNDSGIVLKMQTMWLPEPVRPDPASKVIDEVFLQRLSLHPVPVLRFIRILDRSSEALSHQPGVDPQILQIIDDLKKAQEKLQKLIDENDRELSPC
jgi:hypothetical protein